MHVSVAQRVIFFFQYGKMLNQLNFFIDREHNSAMVHIRRLKCRNGISLSVKVRKKSVTSLTHVILEAELRRRSSRCYSRRQVMLATISRLSFVILKVLAFFTGIKNNEGCIQR